ncbi:hypothetical protein [Bacteroides rodentium]
MPVNQKYIICSHLLNQPHLCAIDRFDTHSFTCSIFSRIALFIGVPGETVTGLLVASIYSACCIYISSTWNIYNFNMTKLRFAAVKLRFAAAKLRSAVSNLNFSISHPVYFPLKHTPP